jgi:hypothetical protein
MWLIERVSYKNGEENFSKMSYIYRDGDFAS